MPPIIEFDDFSGMFQKLKDKEKPKANFTIFMVHRITHGGNAVFGVTNQKGGFALVSDGGRDEDRNRKQNSFAHETTFRDARPSWSATLSDRSSA